MYWGYIKSKDFIYWEYFFIVFVLSEEYDRDGCFLGSVIEKDGKFYVMYIGNVWIGDNYDMDL